MRFAAIADVHGNRLALEAVLADIASLGISEIVNLGDHVSGPLEAARTAELLIDRGFPSILGDQDRRLLELWKEGTSTRMDFRQLEARHLQWLAAMPSTRVYRDEVFMCHGSPKDDGEFWLDYVDDHGTVRQSSRQSIALKARSIDAPLILCGHTHIARVIRLEDGRMVVNPGSVGLPAYEGKLPIPHKVQVGTPDACYAVLERTTSGWSATIRYVRYNNAVAAEMARSNGMPVWANALASGWIDQKC
jgi:predicted phosphodiesterase